MPAPLAVILKRAAGYFPSFPGPVLYTVTPCTIQPTAKCVPTEKHAAEQRAESMASLLYGGDDENVGYG